MTRSTATPVGTGPAARRRIGARELASLLELPPPTEEQIEVIEAGPGPAVVIAGAGSGKTETMAARVVWLVANGLVPADAVLGLTFTRKAAGELGARIRRHLRAWARHLEPEARTLLLAAEPTVLTYAAYSGRLVADHALRLGLEPSTRLISPAVAWQLGDSAVRRFVGPLSDDIGTPPSVTNYVLQLAGELADHLQTPETVIAFSEQALRHIDALPLGSTRTSSAHPGKLADLVRSLNHRIELLPLVANFRADKARIGAVDFADQMVWAANLAGVAEVRAAERDKFQAVLLDEYQDTGHAQIELLSGLFDDGHLVMAVGDPFQSIYSWRGASAGNINRFADTFRHVDGSAAATFTLSTSWRNDRAILLAANEVATELRTAHPLATILHPGHRAADGDVVVARLPTVEDEAVWVAERMRGAWDAAAGADPGRERTAAVLVRRRTQIPLLAAALREAGLPVEIVGLGGLLSTPEVADIVATLHVLADYSSGPALLRLLTGSRWRIGPRDLVALSRRARRLANVDPAHHDRTSTDGADAAATQVGPIAAAPADGSATSGAGRRPRRDPGSIVEALDDLGDPAQYSPAGAVRLGALSAEMRRLRRRLSAPLPELVAEVERTIGVDVEVAARADRRATGRVHLDRFLDAAATFAAEADQATLGAFLAYLTAAEEEENGLEAGEIEVEPERVQLLTVHGAKGLEWDIVAVPGLVDKVFPSEARGHDWTRARHLLPFPLRGDFVDLPPLDIYGATTRRELAGWIEATAKADPPDDLKSRLLARHLLDERRLAYVALTRARHTLLTSAYVWDDTKKPRETSVFLDAIRGHADTDEWFEPGPGDINPLADIQDTARWPDDPLGARRTAVVDGADLVRAAMRGAGPPPSTDGLADADADLASTWAHDIRILLAERAAQRVGPVRDVELPSRLSVSQLVALREDPDDLARRLHRPMPSRPAPLARRGTLFHLWLEQRWGGEKLLDLDELPGAGDETAHTDDDLAALREAFLASEWAERTPHEVEVPFDMVFDGVVVRGRMDAVFADGDGWLVVDWKTGAVPTGVHAQAVAVQLAAYRLAWQRISGASLDSVRAAFHYVPANRTVAPSDLLDDDGLRRLVNAPQGPPASGDTVEQ